MAETLCTITGTLADSSGTTLNGKLTVNLTAPFTVEATTPDTYLSTVPKDYTITSGAINITLRESTTVEIPYRFRFYLSDGDGGYLTSPLIDFNAIVPDVAAVDFSSLVPTGLAPDRLSTGALRVASLILNDPTLFPSVISAVGIFRSFTPPTPSENRDIWLKPDDGTLWTWNSVEAKWLSAPVTVTAEVFQMATDTEALVAIPTYFGKTKALIYSVNYRAKVSSPNSGSNYWTIAAGYQLASNSSLDLISTQQNTSAATAGSLVNVTVSPGTDLELTGASAVEYLGLKLTKQGSPGPINASVSYQLRYFYD